VTGLASDGGSETPQKPVGTMFINGFIKDHPFSDVYKLDGNPPEIILQVVDKAAELVLQKLDEFGI
jgi:nicotinamide-nucleotide amidase